MKILCSDWSNKCYSTLRVRFANIPRKLVRINFAECAANVCNAYIHVQTGCVRSMCDVTDASLRASDQMRSKLDTD